MFSCAVYSPTGLTLLCNCVVVLCTVLCNFAMNGCIYNCAVHGPTCNSAEYGPQRLLRKKEF